MEHKIRGLITICLNSEDTMKFMKNSGPIWFPRRGKTARISLYGRQMRHRFPLSVILMDGMSKNIR